MGNVWQWTNEFMDSHTRTGLVRGGSYYTAIGSMWYFPNKLSNPTSSGVNLLTHNKILLMAPSYDRHGTVGFRCVADAPGTPSPPPPSPPSGCSDGTCDAFCGNALIQGCVAELPAAASMRAPKTGAPCGGIGQKCVAAADACAVGWQPCLSDFTVPALTADAFRAAMTASSCASDEPGRYIAAMSHADCTKCPNSPSNIDIGCKPTGCGAEAICCGLGCVPAGCKSDIYPNATLICASETHRCTELTK